MLLPFAASCDRDAADRPASAAIEVTGDDGVSVRLDAPASRIVSLIPGRTDVLLALGAADRMIARTRWDEDVRIAALPSVEDALTPSVEWLLERKPDLIIAWPDRQSRSVVTRLREIGIPVYASNVETIADVRRSISDLGRLTGHDEAADSILAALASTIGRTRRAVAGLERLRVLYLVGVDPPTAAGPNTFVDEMITIAGGNNVFGDAGARWPPVSMEEVLARRPDLVVVAVEQPVRNVLEQMRSMPGMRALDAVRDGRVHAVDPTLFSRPGPSIVVTLPQLLAILHPGASGS